MDVFNYRGMADTYQAPVNSLQGGSNAVRSLGSVDNVMPPKTANTYDTSTLSAPAAAINDPNVVYKANTSSVPNDVAQQQFRETELNVNGVGRMVNVLA